MNLPNIALVGKAKDEDIDTLNELLDEEELTDLCDVTLYGADDQPEKEALLDAIQDYEDGIVQGIVCLPMQTSIKEALLHAIGEDAKKALPVKINSVMRLASCKGNISIADAAASLTKEDIIDAATKLSKALQNDFFVLTPRIAILSLNKEIDTSEHSEEINIIAPAISELVKNGIQAFGPIASDSFFETPDYQAFDAVLAMYDDQCLQAFKEASNEETITLISGIDIALATSEPTGILKAFYAVTDAARNRKEYQRPFKNPLQKLYHERREDGDKARFVAKKKGFNPAEHRRENVTFTTTRTPKDNTATTADTQNAEASTSTKAE